MTSKGRLLSIAVSAGVLSCRAPDVAPAPSTTKSDFEALTEFVVKSRVDPTPLATAISTPANDDDVIPRDDSESGKQGDVMGLYEFFFPHQAHSDMLHELARSQKLTMRVVGAQRMELAARVAGLEQDLGYVALVLGSILRILDEKGLVTRDDVKREVARLDELDGVKDGRLDIQVLRDLQGS